MDSRQRLEDAYKRKLQRIKVRRSLDNPLKFVLPGKNSSTCKPLPLKLLLLFILVAVFVIVFSSPPVCQQNAVALKVSRLIWGNTDPRYTSHSHINWNEIIQVMSKLPKETKIGGIGLLNFKSHEIHQWRHLMPGVNHTTLYLDYADRNLTWDVLFPEWIDEEQNDEVPSCPTLPRLEVPRQRLDLIAVKLPCRNEGNWSRDVARLHLQISSAGLAAASKGSYPVHLLFVSRCFPIPNLFPCKDLVAHQGDAWLYRPLLSSLRAKLQLPIGSCELALPLGSVETDYTGKRQREAYATILHSAHDYVCGAIAAAQSVGR